jgi:hypothetical protein
MRLLKAARAVAAEAGARRYQRGKIGYILLWLIGVPIPVLFLIYLLRGCT